MLRPGSEAELAEAVAAADGPLSIRGGNTRGLSGEGVPVSTTALSGIVSYEPGSLTLTAQAGTPLAEVEAALRNEGQMLAFEPYDLSGVTGADGATTIGGVFATNASGSRRVQAGAARDFLLGVRFVDGAGRVIKNGGRVMKNVTGYDLVKLMAGSHGTLGVLTEVSFKVLPRPQAVAQVELEGLSDDVAVEALSVALGSPFDVTGALHAPDCIEEGGCTAVRIEGFEDSVAYRAEKLKALWARFGVAHVSDGRESWAAVRKLTSFSRTVRGDGGTLWRLGLKPSDAPGVMAQIAETFDVIYEYDFGGGRVWIWTKNDEPSALHSALQTGVAKVGGHATLIHSDHSVQGPRFQPEPDALAKLSRGLREKFDPKGILNPGLMG